MLLAYKTSLTSSKLKRTPPIGAPKATDTPAAAAADRISLFLASFLPYLGNRYDNILPEIIDQLNTFKALNISFNLK